MTTFYNFSSQADSASDVINNCVRQLSAHIAGNHVAETHITEKGSGDVNFGFIYATDAMTADFPELIELCKTATGIEHWIGSIGVGIITTNQEIYDTPAVSIMLANFDSDDFTMIPSIEKTSINNSVDLTSQIQWPRAFVSNFGIIHGDPLNQETQRLIEALQQQLENGFIVGGLTSSRDKHYQVSGDVVHGGISGVLFSENVSVITNLSQGCRPVGKKHRITKAEENAVFTLDNKPALEMLMHDMDISTYESLEKSAAEVFVGLCIPGSDKSDYTVRNLVGIDIDHSVFAINDYLKEGEDIIFCNRTSQTATDDMQHMLDNIAKRLKQSASSDMIKGGLYFSCLGRGREQFGDNSEEIKMIHKTLGEFPLTGFFANGEIHHNKLYGYTGVLTLFL
jgi:small ligand-binding sensory domain FIST